MWRFTQFLLVGWLIVIPALAQRGGFHGGMGGFHGGGFAGPAFHGGPVYGGYRGFHGYYPGNRFAFGFGYPYWPYYGAGWRYGYPYYSNYPYYYAYSYPYTYYGYGYAYADQISCPQAEGHALYQIKLTYQDNVWVAKDYWYTPGTLNFTTLEGQVNKTPIDTLDSAVTFQLNSACGLNFQFSR